VIELVGVSIIVVAIAIGAWLVGKLAGQIELLIREVREAHKRQTDEIHRLDVRVDDIHKTIGRLEVISGGKGRA
jgi:hypothetical protein